MKLENIGFYTLSDHRARQAGVRGIENEQPMCSKCNTLKGNQPQLLSKIVLDKSKKV